MTGGESMATHMTRRSFLKGSLIGFTGLSLGIHLDLKGLSGRIEAIAREGEATESYLVTIWLNISEDNRITVIVVKNEMGQGIATALAMIVAEELEADWRTINIELLPELKDHLLPGWHATYGSTSILYNYDIMREVGAAAKEMLISACAWLWRVPPESLTASNSTITHPRKGTITYGELARYAAMLPVPESPTLKDPEDFKIIGRSLNRLDTRAHIEGEPVFGIDVVLPEMLHAAVRQAPFLGGRIDDMLPWHKEAGARIVQIPNGIAVVAESWWKAQKILDSISIEWTDPPTEKLLSSSGISDVLTEGLNEPGTKVLSKGDPDSVFMEADTTVEADYYVPLLAHATLEPPTCTAFVTPLSCEVWAPTQYAEGIDYRARKITGLPSSAIKIYTTNIGGGFGRKAESDFAVQAITISKAVGRPVKVIWSRAEDLQHDFYRPAFMARMAGGLDQDGKIISWNAKTVGSSVMIRPPLGIWNLYGFKFLPYSIPNKVVEYVHRDYGVPIGWMRGVGFSRNTFFVESFMDELAHAAAIDPIEFRLGHLVENPRCIAVLEKVAEIADWGNPTVPGAEHGVSIMEHQNKTYVAEIAEVSVDESNRVIVHKVYCAIDIGRVINPDIVKAQIEGCIVFGISTGLYNEITIHNGVVEQSNFHDYPLKLLKDSPEVEVSIIDSQEDPAGIGEYGVPGIAPAVTNAIFGLTEERIRILPITKHGFRDGNDR
jgi:isoquinoline 1-oxidoreductase beta subunit